MQISRWPTRRPICGTRNRLLKDMVRDRRGMFRAGTADGRSGSADPAPPCAALQSDPRKAQRRPETASTATLDLTMRHAKTADGLRQALAITVLLCARILSAGRTLIGPHRADLEGVYAG